MPTVDPRLALALGKPSHGDSVARRTGESIRRLTSSASQEVTEETRIGRELQQPVTTGRVIAVTSIRGGVGKTTTAALLARTFNHYRHDPVLALEADAALGTLPVRMGAESVRWSCAELARILTPSMRLTDITGYLVPVSDGGWLLPASQGRLGAPLDIPTYRTVTLALRRYFAVTVVDCETLPGEVARTAMDTAHARVVVAPLTAEGVGGTRVVLDWLAQLPHEALAFTVVALTSGTPDLNLDLKTATAHLRETGVTIVHLPYDRHLAAAWTHPYGAARLRHAPRGHAARGGGAAAGGAGPLTQHLVHRPARATRPLPAAEARTIEPPPNLPEGKMGSAATALLPIAGVMSSVVMMTVIRSSQFAGLGAVVLVVALLGAVALFLSQRGKAQRQRRVQRERYLEYLEELREELGAAEQERRRAARELNPPPSALYDLVRDPARLWERRRTDADFLRVRVGVGDVPVQDVVVGQNSASGVLTPPDPFMLNEARALQARFRATADHPLTVPLDRVGNVSILGDREGVLRVARALLAQAAVTHAPDDLALALGVPGERMAEWEWAKWLPHVLDPEELDGPVAGTSYRTRSRSTRAPDRRGPEEALVVRRRGAARSLRPQRAEPRRPTARGE